VRAGRLRELHTELPSSPLLTGESATPVHQRLHASLRYRRTPRRVVGPNLNVTPNRTQNKNARTDLRCERKPLQINHLQKAGDGTRTRDLQLGKLTLYQLSYSRRPASTPSLYNPTARTRSRQPNQTANDRESIATGVPTATHCVLPLLPFPHQPHHRRPIQRRSHPVKRFERRICDTPLEFADRLR
jgi:hypothetical protein